MEEATGLLKQQDLCQSSNQPSSGYLELLIPELEESAARWFMEADRAYTCEEDLERFAHQFSCTVEITRSLGLDYELALVRRTPLFNKTEHPHLLEFLISLPGRFSSEGVQGENHGYGYHIHYIVAEKRKAKRTNVLLTFDPKEPKVSVR